MLRKIEKDEFTVNYKEEPLYISLGVLYAGTFENQNVAIKIACDSGSTSIDAAYDALVNEIKKVNMITEYMSDKNHAEDTPSFHYLLTHHGYGKVTFSKQQYVGLFIEPPFCTLDMILYDHPDNVYPRFPWETKNRIAENITKGVSFLHKIGIIHCSLNPRAVYIIKGTKGRFKFKLGGFGLAQEKDEVSEYNCRGSLLFKAPEVIQHQRYSEKSDIFSLGIMFWEIGVERKIYGGKVPDKSKFIKRICDGQREAFPPGFNNKKWETLSAWATEQNPEDRPSPKELLAELTDKNMSEKLTAIAIAKNIIEDPKKREEKNMQLVEVPPVEESSSSSDVLKDERLRRARQLAAETGECGEMVTVKVKKKSMTQKIISHLFLNKVSRISTHENENKRSDSKPSQDFSPRKVL